jgi:carbamoyl-phosphate synthase large subunit
MKRIWADFGVMIGVDVNAINITEDREQFKQLLKNVPSAPAEICTSYLRKRNCTGIWFSISDSSFVYIRRNRAAIVYKEDFDELLTRGRSISIHEVLIDKLMGWKECNWNF